MAAEGDISGAGAGVSGGDPVTVAGSDGSEGDSAAEGGSSAYGYCQSVFYREVKLILKLCR